MKRLGGNNRNETNANVLETFYKDIEIKNAYVAKDGRSKENQLIDALSVGVLAAKNDSPVIIMQGVTTYEVKTIKELVYSTLTQNKEFKAKEVKRVEVTITNNNGKSDVLECKF